MNSGLDSTARLIKNVWGFVIAVLKFFKKYVEGWNCVAIVCEAHVVVPAERLFLYTSVTFHHIKLR